ncbi:hypothetical protein M758_5G173900 [Ceratodon purpureus]|nr:hypothetical protein M758_5G173900 [Ceratodon purpureus]
MAARETQSESLQHRRSRLFLSSRPLSSAVGSRGGGTDPDRAEEGHGTILPKITCSSCLVPAQLCPVLFHSNCNNVM